MKATKAGLSFGRVTYLHGDDGSVDRQSIVYLNGKEVGHMYFEAGMICWAADGQLESLFGENTLDGYRHIREARAVMTRQFNRAPADYARRAYELAHEFDDIPARPYYGPADAPARRRGRG